MEISEWKKSSDVLVLPRFGIEGLTLQHQKTHKMVKLDRRQADFWITWPEGSMLDDFGDTLDSLISGDFLLSKAHFDPPGLSSSSFDNMTLRQANNNVRWHEETPDLTILFNSQVMSQNNPLLALSPLGSLIWKGVTTNKSVLSIRQEAARVFGNDEVLPFIKRLHDVGMIEVKSPQQLPNFGSNQLTKEFSAPDVQWSLHHSGVPWYCLWEVNTVCNLRCKTCYLPHFTSRGPTPEAAEEIAQQLIDAGVFYICIMGGESLLRKDLESIIQRLRGAGLFVKIITNGHHLTEERVLSLANAGINMVEVSFDGLQPATHDKSRGPGAFDKAVAAVQQLQRSNIPRIAVVWTLHSENQSDFERLPAFLSDLDVHECYISQFKKTGANGGEASFYPVDAAWVEKAQNKLREWKDQNPQQTIVLMPGCTCARTSTVIGYNGDVRTCSFSYESKIGNVYENSFADIWSSIATTIPDSGPVGFCTKRGASEKTVSVAMAAKMQYLPPDKLKAKSEELMASAQV